MKRIVQLVVVMGLVCLTGCASSRFALLDVDLRTPEQTTAYIPEAEIVYKAPVEVQKEGMKTGLGAIPVVVWEYVTQLLQVTRGRIRVFSFEAKK